jgi:hypothetical protein
MNQPQDYSTNDIASILITIRSLIKGLGSIMVTGFIAAAWFIISDHFGLVRVTEDTDWMRPRVQSMWYKGHADMQESVDATINHSSSSIQK